MDTPTERLTKRAATMLSTEVALAIRVRECASDDSEFLTAADSDPLTPYPAGGLPVVPMYRAAKHYFHVITSDDHHKSGVLAFTRAGERILMGRSRYRSLQPTDEMRRLSATAPISVDYTLLSEQLIPKIAVDGECFIVNSVDFGVLTRASVEGELDTPELAEQLRPYYEQAKVFQSYDPNTLRAMLPGQQRTTSASR